MSQHPSLKTSKAGKKHRSVLKRFERFFTFKEKGVMDDSSSVFGLPKLKVVRTRIKKEKAEEKPGEVQAAAEGAAAPQKEGVTPKGAAPKPEKKAEKKEKGKK